MINYPTIAKYLVSLFSRQFFSTSAVIVAILIVSNAFDTLKNFKAITIEPREFWLLIFYKVPYLFNEVSVIVGFIATILFIQAIRKNNELIIILSNGIAIWKIFLVPAAVTFVFGIVIVAIINPLGTYGLREYKNLEAKLTGKSKTNLIVSQSGIFFYEKFDSHNRVIQAESINTNKKMLCGLTILVVDSQNNLIQRFDAPSAYIDSGVFTLSNAVITYSDFVEKADELKLPTNLSINSLVLRFSPPERINLWDLANSIRKFAKSGLPVTKYQLHYFKQLLKPLAMVSMAFIACWFVSLNLRDNSNSTVLVVGIIWGICTYFLLELSFRILAYSGLTPLLAILLPISFIILISNFVILHFQEA
ncbi:MAG: LptF/LptG family permease [Rickettsiaceae bacterium]